ncbi:MAG: hypothetical protein AAF292_06975 [Pseudomonadota bacterium]
MVKQDFEAHLEQLFRDVESVFEDDSERFAAQVAKSIRFRKWQRRIVLSIFAMFGGVLAAFQLPAMFELLENVVGLDGEIRAVVDNALLAPLDVPMEWFAAVLVGIATFFAALAGEQS